MKLISLTLILISSLWAQKKYDVKSVYFNLNGTPQYGKMRHQVPLENPMPDVVPVSYDIYKDSGISNRSSSSLRLPYKELVFATESIKVALNNQSYTIGKGKLIIGEDGEIYSVVDVFNTTGKVALNKLTNNPNSRNQDPKYFNRSNNTVIYDKSFISAVEKTCFSSYCQGKTYSQFGNSTYCEYLQLLRAKGIEGGVKACMGNQNTQLKVLVNYAFSDGTLIVNQKTRMSLPQLLERYSPSKSVGDRAVQGQ